MTGQEIGEVQLGGYDRPGQESGGPTHAGGVTVDGDNVYVVDNGEVYTYSLEDMQSRGTGETVPQSAPPQKGLDGGSYSTIKDGRLYLGDHEKNELYVYEKGPSGQWVKVDTIDTPDNSQGVIVRDDELVFSSSSGRHQDHSSLVVQDMDGNRSEPYELPSMSQGVVEVDGNLVVTYESGAEEFDHAIGGTSGWWWLLDDYRDLWANPNMTVTPLSELGLSEDVEVEPGTLSSAAADFASAGNHLVGVSADVSGVRVPAGIFGDVPRAASFATAVESLLEAASDSLRTGARAVDATAELLSSSALDYGRTDERVDGAFRGITPR